MAKTLVLIRHAHRDIEFDSADNSLSQKGQAQAIRLLDFYRDRFGLDKAGVTLLSSPKQRTRETLRPIAEALGREIRIEPLLDEEGSGGARLDLRVEQFIEKWMSGPPGMTIACTHGDWLPIAAYKLLRLHIQFKKASWFEVEDEMGQIELRWMIPSFKCLYE